MSVAWTCREGEILEGWKPLWKEPGLVNPQHIRKASLLDSSERNVSGTFASIAEISYGERERVSVHMYVHMCVPVGVSSVNA